MKTTRLIIYTFFGAACLLQACGRQEEPASQATPKESTTAETRRARPGNRPARVNRMEAPTQAGEITSPPETTATVAAPASSAATTASISSGKADSGSSRTVVVAPEVRTAISSSQSDVALLQNASGPTLDDIAGRLRPRVQQIQSAVPSMNLGGDDRQDVENNLEDINTILANTSAVDRQQAYKRLKDHFDDIQRILQK